MANRFKKQWILEDELYINDNATAGSYRLNIHESTFVMTLMKYGQSALPNNEDCRILTKIAAIQGVYYYLYRQQYLTDERYAIDYKYDSANGTFSFKLNLTKLLNDVELEKELNKVFTPKKFYSEDEYIEKAMDEETFNYIGIICHPKQKYCCKYCGTMRLCESRFDMYNLSKRYGCEKCNSLSNDKRAIVCKAHRDTGLIEAINQRNAFAG